MRISDWSSDVCSSDLAVVVVPGFWLRILAVVEQLAGRGIQCLSENLGLRVASLEAEIFEADREREEFAERVPAQAVFLDKLFDMLRRRAACPGLVHSAAGPPRHDRPHLRSGPAFHQRARVGELTA